MKNHSQTMVVKLFPDHFEKVKFEYISGSIVQVCQICVQFVFIVCQVQGCRNILKLN